MKQIHLYRESYPEDVTRIQHAVIHVGRVDCSRAEAAELWRLYSDEQCAGWLMLGTTSDEAIWKAVEVFIVIENER